jgi:hypothetical protein
MPATHARPSRGARALVANPHFRKNPALDALAALPTEHPDYEPPEACAPTRLFAVEVAAARRAQPARAAKLPPRTPPPARAAAVKAEPSTPRVPSTPTGALCRALGPRRR